MGLNISCCENLCDYIHHSRDTPETTFADPGQWSVGQRGLPCPFLYINSQVLSVHATCWLVGWSLFQLTSSCTAWNMTCSWQAEKRELRLNGGFLEIVHVRWMPSWNFKKLLVLSQLNAVTEHVNEEKNSGFVLDKYPFAVGEMPCGCCWRMMWNFCRLALTYTSITKSRPYRRCTAMHVITAIPFCLSKSMIQPQVPPPEHHRRSKVQTPQCHEHMWNILHNLADVNASQWSGNLYMVYTVMPLINLKITWGRPLPSAIVQPFTSQLCVCLYKWGQRT